MFSFFVKNIEVIMQEMLEILYKKIENLEKRLEKYYEFLKVDNELDFIMKGTYLLEEEITPVLQGEY